MKKLILFLLALCLTATTATAQTYGPWDCGYCGDEYSGCTPTSNVTAILVDGVLTISGMGAMKDYNGGSAPWYNNRYSITSVVIDPGVTTIGSDAL